MQPGIFQGIENGEMKIEYQTNPATDPEKTRIFSYPVGGDRRDTGFYGFGLREGTIGCHPDLPAVGQKVQYDGPKPDMAGHLMVRVFPAEVANDRV